MAGHSHWKNIKRKKGALDAKRGKIWSKLSRAVIVAARTGGPNPDFNPTLRYAMDKARAANMPNDTIDKAVKKGVGEGGAETFESTMYEGFAPGGVAVLCEILTDNRNRTAPEIRKIFERHGANMSGSVAWMFKLKGEISVPASATSEEALMDLVLEAGADDIAQEGDQFIVTCEPAAFENVKKAILAAKLSITESDLTKVPTQTVPVSGKQAESVMALLEALEDHDDVQNVYSNFETTEETAN